MRERPAPDQQDPPAPAGRPLPRRQGRILLNLLAVLVIVGLAPLGTVAWKLIVINREALKGSQQEFQHLLASTVSREVGSHVDGMKGQLTRTARSVGQAPGREAVRRILAEGIDDRILYLRFFSVEGWREASGPSAAPAEVEAQFASGLRLAAEAAARHEPGAVAVSGPILLEGPRAALVLTAPVVEGGHFRGYVSALAELQGAWEGILRAHPVGHVLYVADRQGRVILSDGKLVRAGSVVAGTPLVDQFLAEARLNSSTLPFRADQGDGPVEWLGSYQKTNPEGWGVFVQAPEREVYGAVAEMVQSTTLWALGAIALAGLLAIVFARTVSVPIERLAEASRALAARQLDTRVEVRSRNEIGVLADAYNEMASEIEAYTEKLRRAAQDNKDLFMGTIRALAESIDAKDPYTNGHSKRVNRYSVILGETLGLGKRELEEVKIASLLHDVGKIGIDDAILKKPAPLTREEFEVMKRHTIRGGEIMALIPKMQPIIPGLRNHHEKWNGSGYPDGLAGEAIPLLARIIAVADTFDAMTTDRPYQKAMSFPSALARLNELKGVALDERVVEAFNRAYRAGQIRPESPAAAELQAVPA